MRGIVNRFSLLIQLVLKVVDCLGKTGYNYFQNKTRIINVSYERSFKVIKVNEYFDGKVKSFVINSSEGKKTVGVMEPGEYEFDTDTKEIMTVVEGNLSVYFAEDDEWEEFEKGASFDVPAKSKLKVKVEQDTAYICEYE